MSILRIEQCGGTETVKALVLTFLLSKRVKNKHKGSAASLTQTHVKQRLLEQHLVFALHSLQSNSDESNIYALLIGKDDTVGRAEPVTLF